jgi:hypothetical protein
MALIDLEIQNLSTRQSDHHLKTEKLLTQQKKKTLVGVSTNVTIWLFNIAMERSTIFKNGKPSISMGHLYHGYVK